MDFDDYQAEIRESPKRAEGAKRERSDEFNTLAIEKLLDNCAFIRHCQDDSATLSEPHWWSMVHVLGVFGEPGRKKIHELSEPYPRYSVEETEQKIKEALKAADFLGRVGWKYLIKDAALRKFDVLLVWKIDRSFRSVIHAANTLNMLRGYRVGFRSYTEPSIDTTTPHGEFIFNIMTAVAALERQTTSQRVRAGTDYAKQHGTKSGNKIGRKRYDVPLQLFVKPCRLPVAIIRQRQGGYLKRPG